MINDSAFFAVVLNWKLLVLLVLLLFGVIGASDVKLDRVGNSEESREEEKNLTPSPPITRPTGPRVTRDLAHEFLLPRIYIFCDHHVLRAFSISA